MDSVKVTRLARKIDATQSRIDAAKCRVKRLEKAKRTLSLKLIRELSGSAVTVNEPSSVGTKGKRRTKRRSTTKARRGRPSKQSLAMKAYWNSDRSKAHRKKLAKGENFKK